MSEHFTLPSEEEIAGMTDEQLQALIDQISTKANQLEKSNEKMDREIARFHLFLHIQDTIFRIHTPPLWNDEYMAKLQLGITSMSMWLLVSHHTIEELRGFFCVMFNAWCDGQEGTNNNETTNS